MRYSVVKLERKKRVDMFRSIPQCLILAFLRDVGNLQLIDNQSIYHGFTLSVSGCWREEPAVLRVKVILETKICARFLKLIPK